MEEFFKQLIATSESAGFKMLTDDYCCRILAWTYAYGGGISDVVTNKILYQTIMYARGKLNLFGGEIPNMELMPLLNKYLSETDGYLKMDKSYKHPQWAIDIFNRYEIKIPELYG